MVGVTDPDNNGLSGLELGLEDRIHRAAGEHPLHHGGIEPGGPGGGLQGARAPAVEGHMVKGGQNDPVVASADAILGRMLVMITKLEAAEREGRGAVVTDVDRPPT